MAQDKIKGRMLLSCTCGEKMNVERKGKTIKLRDMIE